MSTRVGDSRFCGVAFYPNFSEKTGLRVLEEKKSYVSFAFLAVYDILSVQFIMHGYKTCPAAEAI